MKKSTKNLIVVAAVSAGISYVITEVLSRYVEKKFPKKNGDDADKSANNDHKNELSGIGPVLPNRHFDRRFDTWRY